MSNESRRAALPCIILAAGQGKRLGVLTEHTPKALLPVAGRPMLERCISSIHSHLPEAPIFVITAFEAQAFAPYVEPGRVESVFVPEALTANNIVSLYYALEKVNPENGFWLFNSDVVYEESILCALRNFPADNALAVNFGITDAEAMKVSATENAGSFRLFDIAKTILPEASLGEYIGLARFDAYGTAALKKSLQELIFVQNKTSSWYEEAILHIFPSIPVYACKINPAKCAEIDTPEDLALATQLFS